MEPESDERLGAERAVATRAVLCSGLVTRLVVDRDVAEALDDRA